MHVISNTSLIIWQVERRDYMGNSNRFYADVMALHEEVTGSCMLLNIKFPDRSAKKILIDCGLFQEADYSKYNQTLPFDVTNIDHVIVTHNHVDHTGRLPLLVKKGYQGKIHMSYDTATLLPNALKDSYKVLKIRAKLANEHVLYTEDDVDKTLEFIEGHNFEESIWIDENIKITFFMNGHLPGAVVVLLQIKYHSKEKHYEDINILFTGDYNNKNVFFDVNPIPKWVHQLPLTIVQESTYGNMNSEDIQCVFEKNILDSISKGKEIVIPVFSLGRSQEILLFLKNLQDENKLDKNIPIYFDGKLGMKYTRLFTTGKINIKEECKDFLPENLDFVTSKKQRDEITKDFKCKIILTTSGMGSHGPALTYLPIYIKRENALIHFTGYCAEGTLGRLLYESEKDSIVEVFGLKVKKLADVKFTSEFSAHAKADELIDFLKPFENIKMLLINHGSYESKNSYSEKVIREIDPKDIGVLNRMYYYRLNGYGLARPPITTKFSQVS